MKDSSTITMRAVKLKAIKMILRSLVCYVRKILLSSAMFCVGVVLAYGNSSSNPPISYQGSNSSTNTKIQFAVSLGKYVAPVEQYQMLVQQLKIYHNHRLCIVDTENTTGIVSLESVNYEPFYWTQNGVRISGIFEPSGVSTISWAKQLKGKHCSVPAQSIEITQMTSTTANRAAL